MECRALPFRQLPHQSKLFIQFLDNFPSVKQFYGHPPTISSVKKAMRSFDYPRERRAEVAGILRQQNAAFGTGEATRENLERLLKGAIAVVSPAGRIVWRTSVLGVQSGERHSDRKGIDASGAGCCPCFLD